MKPIHYEWLEERTIILAPTGSYAYGTNTEESDKDYKGVCIPPVSYYLGLESFNEYNSSGGKNFKNTKDVVDINIIHITKFVKDAMTGVPNNMEILFLRREQYLKVTALGQRLIDNRHLFLSKAIQRKFGGYANAQIQQLKQRNKSRSGRMDLIQQYGYDTKFFMHSVRLLTSAIEILETGDFSTYRPNRNLLLDCRNGKYTFNEAVELVAALDIELKKAAERSTLPEKPDYHAINELLVSINTAAIVQKHEER
ncbi:nucleotidyltransferase domain-containing protein [Terribacillus sp. 179-K 1B1 HS]|uniref:nucleotidyltransferase domain-containing protein n=1 Tax=Terribacillus sp. 179-K 1B1 HS TaxID=3142388 RepID=UPI0039A3CFAE